MAQAEAGHVPGWVAMRGGTGMGGVPARIGSWKHWTLDEGGNGVV